MAPATHSSYTLNVSNDDGTTSSRTYSVYRPGKLKPSPTNLAPAILVFYGGGNCGFNPPGRFISMAAPDRFIVVAMEIPCGRVNHWEKRNVDSSSTAAPNDEPYVAAVVNDITQCPSTGAGPNQCVDPKRIYAAGLSSGGNMVGDIMCDVQNSPLFRGYLIDSSSLQLFNGAPHCPSPNRSFFVMLAVSNYGPDSGLYYDTTANPHLDVSEFADWAGSRLGCTKGRTDDAIGAPVASTLRYTYIGPCAYAAAGSAAVMALGVQNGAHGWGCQDSDAGTQPGGCPSMTNPPGLDPAGRPRTNGLFVEQAFWNFVSQGYSSSTPASPLSETQPPTVAMATPANGATVSGDVTVGAHASDDTAVASVQIELDGNDLGAQQNAGPAGLYSVAWNTTTASLGRHALRAIARDVVGNTAISASTVANVEQATAHVAGPTWAALGDAYSSGAGDPPYLAGTNSARNRCRRSLVAYPYFDAVLLRLTPANLAFHACSGAKIADFYRADRHDPGTPQLKWVDPATRIVTVTVGWADASLPEVIQACGRAPTHCQARWRRVVKSAIVRMGKTSASSPNSLSRLYRMIAAAGPHAKVIVLGYPRLFPALPPRSCQLGAHGPRLKRASMKWINSLISGLDKTSQDAAASAHVTYATSSYSAFAGHESCTRQSYMNGSLYPNGRGQLALAQLIVRFT